MSDPRADGGDDESPAAESTDAVGEQGAGGARMDDEAAEAERAVTGETPVEAAVEARGVVGPLRAWYEELTDEERYVSGAVLGFFGLLGLLVLVGALNFEYLLSLLSLAGMYVLLTMGLNVQWGYSGLINFSVAAFFGVGAYTAALLASADSPLTGGSLLVVTIPGIGPVDVLGAPVVGIFVAMVVAAVLAVLIGYPTLSLREDYLAIASLGLAEVIRIGVKNQQNWTGGSRGLLGMPKFLVRWPVIGGFVADVPKAVLDLVTISVFVFLAWLFLRRVHRSPWGRVQRLIRSDEDIAEALGKNTFRLRMESFVVGSVLMALAGVFFVHYFDSVFPSSLGPIKTFYVWIAVILGGSGSDRGAIIGGLVIVTITQGVRFVAQETTVSMFGLAVSVNVPIDQGALRLLLVGLLIIGLMRYRPEGVLPPQRELIWPAAQRGGGDE